MAGYDPRCTALSVGRSGSRGKVSFAKATRFVVVPLRRRLGSRVRVSSATVPSSLESVLPLNVNIRARVGEPHLIFYRALNPHGRQDALIACRAVVDRVSRVGFTGCAAFTAEPLASADVVESYDVCTAGSIVEGGRSGIGQYRSTKAI